MVKRLFRVLKIASKVVAAVYEASKSIIQLRRVLQPELFVKGSIVDMKVDGIPHDTCDQTITLQQIAPLSETLLRMLTPQVAQLAACNQAFRDGVMLLWKENLDEDLFVQAIEDLYLRYKAERDQLGVSRTKIFYEIQAHGRDTLVNCKDVK